MNHQPVHIHSMLVHAVIAFAPLAACSFLLDATGATVAGIGPPVWRLLLWGSLVGMLAVALPATVTGIAERNHLYANWPPSHRAKLALSAILIALIAIELYALWLNQANGGGIPWLGVAVVIGNNAVALALSYYGLRITLGRQALAATSSYVADMDREPPVDILDVVAHQAAEPARMVDVRQEGGG
ncbi:MAG: hypothetical protein LJE93_07640 [Acidobacteria bacterium]|nr:hypothetical protein [Acidobacteriota bacterium]